MTPTPPSGLGEITMPVTLTIPGPRRPTMPKLRDAPVKPANGWPQPHPIAGPTPSGT